MALVFGAGSTDGVNCGTLGSYNVLTTTVLMWVKPSTLTANRNYCTKANTSGQGFFVAVGGGAGNQDEINAGRRRGGPHVAYQTNNAGITAGNKWWFIGVVFNSSAGAGELFNIYVGDLSTLATERTYGSAVDGTGSFMDNSASPWKWGSSNETGFEAPFEGAIATGIVIDQVLTAEEIQAWQFHPRNVPNAKLLTVLGYAGTGTQPDWSGNANDGTVTGATVGDHVPIRFRRAGPLYVPYTVAAAAGVTITDVDPAIFSDAQAGIVITGSGF